MLRTNRNAFNQENIVPPTTVKANASTNNFATPAPPTNLRRTALAPKSTNAKPRAELIDKSFDDYGKTHPAPPPLKDEPIEYNIDETFPQLRPENFKKGFAEVYYRNDEADDERRKKQRELDEAGYNRGQKELDRVLEEGLKQIELGSKSKTENPQKASRRDRAVPTKEQSTATNSRPASLVKKPGQHVLKPRANHKQLSSAAMGHTAASKSKQKPAFSIARDEAPARGSLKVSGSEMRPTSTASKDKNSAASLNKAVEPEQPDDDLLLFKIDEIQIDMGVDIDNFEL